MAAGCRARSVQAGWIGPGGVDRFAFSERWRVYATHRQTHKLTQNRASLDPNLRMQNGEALLERW